MGISKNRGTPKWMVDNGKPYEQMDDLGVPLFLETPTSSKFSCVDGNPEFELNLP